MGWKTEELKVESQKGQEFSLFQVMQADFEAVLQQV
jgi:hypothetical protein